MKRWQKASGVIVFTGIGVFDLLLWSTLRGHKILHQAHGEHDLVTRTDMRTESLSVAMWTNYFVALVLFVRFWRKERKP